MDLPTLSTHLYLFIFLKFLSLLYYTSKTLQKNEKYPFVCAFIAFADHILRRQKLSRALS